jgi:hypothetical protein
LGYALGVLVFFAAPITSRPGASGVVWTIGTDRFVEESCAVCRLRYISALARRAWVVRSLREERPGGQFFDAGNLASEMGRANMLLDIDRALGCQFVLLGAKELALGAEFVQALKSRGMVGVCLNNEGERLRTALPQPATKSGKGEDDRQPVVPYVMFAVKGLRVAVTAVVTTPTSDREWKEVGEMLQKAKTEAGNMVVFSYLHTPERDRLLQTCGRWIDLLVDTHSTGPEQIVGGTRVIPVADRHNEVGELTCAGERVEVQFHPIPADGPRDEVVLEIAENFFRSFQSVSREQGEDSGMTVTRNNLTGSPRHPCGSCHERQVEQWQSTRHASALQSLRDKGDLSPQCLFCHSESYHRLKQAPPVAIPHPQGVSCSSCHGEGLLHALMPRQKGLDVRRQPDEATCRSCHDAAHDPDFDFARTWEKVRH